MKAKGKNLNYNRFTVNGKRLGSSHINRILVHIICNKHTLTRPQDTHILG